MARVEKQDGEDFVGLADEHQTQVVAHLARIPQGGTRLEHASLQQRDGLLNDPVFVRIDDNGIVFQLGMGVFEGQYVGHGNLQ